MRRLPLILVVIHSILLSATIGSMLLCESNPDGSFGMFMMGVVFYLIDMPVGLIFELLRPSFKHIGGWLPVSVGLFGLLGNLMWYSIGVFIRWIWLRKRQ